ncbi:hypothetical protein PENTCL1PPCAC_20484, partial [Pristionchus entomophagus]
ACRSGFQYYEGWCVHTANGDDSYQQAISDCAATGVTAPSIHSKNDLDFWSKAVTNTGLNIGHFWLNAYCASAGQAYQWKDGTPTDYMGPNGELRSCKTGYGYHIHSDGFEIYDYPTGAYALCAYPADRIDDPTTIEPTTLEPSTPEPTSIDVTADYCTCEPNSIYLDIVFITDVSADMTSKTVGDATATIQSTLYGLTFGTVMFQSNVAAIAFADTVQTVRNFGGFRSVNDINTFSLPYLGGKTSKMADAIKQASSMISSNGRSFTRGVIVLLSKSFNQLDAVNIEEAAEAFKDDGGIFITIDYAKGAGINGLQYIASPGYHISDASSKPELNAEMLYAFCDANCFCPDGLYPYDVVNEKGRELPMGCYHVADVPAVYDAAEQNFFPLKARYWLGLKRHGRDFEWADGADDKFTYWAPGNPIPGQDCVYGQQQTGFNSPWFSAPCTDPLKYSMTYACQLRPCDSEYACWS